MSGQASRAANPQMSGDFARVYEGSAHPITEPVSVAGLEMVGVGPSTRLLDIAAGAVALSIPAAEKGVRVVATDVAPGMERRWRHAVLGLAPGLTGAVARVPHRRQRMRGDVARSFGGGPLVLMATALRSAFPDRPSPRPPEDMAVLSDPGRLEAEMRAGGFDQAEVRELQSTWKGPASNAYFEGTEALHRHMRPCAALDEAGHARIESAISRSCGCRHPRMIWHRSCATPYSRDGT